MKLPLIMYEKGLVIKIDYGSLTKEEIGEVKKILDTTRADFQFFTSHEVKGKKGTIMGFELPFLTKDQYRKLKGV